MKQFLAYGNSDQASFRQPDVRAVLDYLTVPGTIAAYYPDATAAFVLSSELQYIIDLRTPLFQGHIASPRASHFALASWLGPAVQGQMGDPDDPTPVTFESNWYAGAALDEMVARALEEQRKYGGRAEVVEARLARYEALLAEALGRQSSPTADDSVAVRRPPSFVLAPYFAAASYSDPWWEVNLSIWSRCRSLGASDVSPVVAVGSAFMLEQALSSVPVGFNQTQFFWITGLDERRASESELLAVAAAVRASASRVNLVNLYGTFFSICLDYVGLWGFGSGLGYSESRSWPELPQTGAAPARYYIRRLHSFVAPAVAQRLIDADDYFACECNVCHRRAVAGLQYADLKRHFAAARAWEKELVRSQPPAAVAANLDEAANRIEAEVATRIPARLVPDVRHLRSWAGVLRAL